MSGFKNIGGRIMKRSALFISIYLILILVFIICSCSTDPLPPDPDPLDPDPPEFILPAQTVMYPAPAGAWDDRSVGWCSVVSDGDTLRMWYSGNSDADRVFKIGYAWSTNYTDWHRYGDTYVLAISYKWEGPDFGRPVVIKDNGVFHMWYHGWSEDVPIVVGYAQSKNGINWEKHDQPVMERMASGIGSYEIGLWSVMKDDGLFRGWYYGTNNTYSSGQGCISYATSMDGISYADEGFCLYQSSANIWEKDFAIWPLVLKTNLNGALWLEMYYLGFSKDQVFPDLGYAVKKDISGTDWHKYAKNPVLLNSQLTVDFESLIWSDAMVRDPETGVYHLFYTAYQDGYKIRHIIGIRE